MAVKIAAPHQTRDIQHPVTDDDPFRYGWRTVVETGPAGEIIYRDIPLTQADFLDPQTGDQMNQGNKHYHLAISLYHRFYQYSRQQPTVGVFGDIKMRWGIPGLKEPAPDLAIIPNLKDKDAHRRSFNVLNEGTRPCLVVEIMSPDYPGDDTAKVEIYQRAGVAEYIIINPHFEAETMPFELQGYRLVEGQYHPIAADAQGRLLSETTGLWFGLGETGRDIVLTEAATGERLLTVEEEAAARRAAEAEVARLRALLARYDNG